MTDEEPTPKPGTRVVIKPEARPAVGRAEGVVVGVRDAPPPGVVVAVDGKGPSNAVVAPEDLEQRDD